MIRSFISLKPQSPSTSLKKYTKAHKKPVDLIIEGIEELFNILKFLQLDLIYKLYFIYKQTAPGKQVAKKIVIYLTLESRRYSILEEKSSIRYLTKYFRKFTLKQYSSQNQIWKQSINLDIQRTSLSRANSKMNSQSNLLQKNKNIQQKELNYDQQLHNLNYKNQLSDSAQSKIHRASSVRQNIIAVKLNFLIFNNSNQETLRKKQIQKRNAEDKNMKNYCKTILNAISNRNRKLGYVQGLNFWIKNMFESKLTEDQAFIYACYLLQEMKVQALFQDEMTKVRELCYVFDVYLFNNLPDLYYLLKTYDVSSTVYASNWFITLFSQQLNKQVVKKIWNLFVIKGWKILIKFGLAVMCAFQQQIKASPHDQIHCFMRNILETIGAEKERNIWAIMGSIKVSNKMIEYLSKEMKILYNDAEIQLWRLQQQKNQGERIRRLQQRKYIFNCHPSISTIDCRNSQKKMHLMSAYFNQETSNGCCSTYSPQKLKTQSFQQNYSLLSACRGINFK